MDRAPGRRFAARAGWIAGVIVAGGLLAACSAEPPGQAPAASVAPGGGSSAQPGAAAALVIDADTVQGPKNLLDAEKPLRSCVQASRFAHNEQVVWRVKVYDGSTGEALDDTALTGVQVKLPDQTLDLKYGGHPAQNPADHFWTTSWTVPEGYPSGTIDYTILAAAADGRTATWQQFKVTAAYLTVTDDVRTVVAAPSPS